MLRPLISLLFATTLQAQDLKSIFRTPTKKNYDQFEILERSNFDSDDSGPPPANRGVDNPRSFANAQVMLRFGGDQEKCACGDTCQCKGQPYYLPVFTPVPCLCIPPYYPYPRPAYPPCPIPLSSLPSNTFVPPHSCPYCGVPPTTPPPPVSKPAVESQPEVVVQDNTQNNQVNVVQNTNVVNEAPQVGNSVVQQNVEIKNNHPQILDTVNLSDEVVKPVREQQGEDEKLLQQVSNRIEPVEVTPNVKFVKFDLCKVPTQKSHGGGLDEALVSYLGNQQRRPKLLVTYPIFNKPQNDLEVPLPVQFSQSGYSVSGASGYYADPVRTVIYKKPTVLSIIGPQSRTGYVLVPVGTPVRPHPEECCCCSCAKYRGELNEQI